MNELLGEGPVLKAKNLRPGDIIQWNTGGYTYTYRVLLNGEDEALLRQHKPGYTESSKRVGHFQMDKAKFAHIGVKPGWFKGMFCDIIKF